MEVIFLNIRELLKYNNILYNLYCFVQKGKTSHAFKIIF